VHRSTSGANDLDGLVQELHRQESSKAKMEIGDVIRVRGYIKVFRMQREVVASIFYAEKGCHFLHILNCVQQDFGSCINEAILQRVINALEQNSDIVSTMEKYYTAF
ncbi:hypothetical protein AB205_0077860, partial [Aquarana catesbeiana]